MRAVEIDGGDFRAGGEEINHGVDGFASHLLFAIRSRVYVAVHTALVAAVAQVQLQRLDGVALEVREISAGEQVNGGVHERIFVRSCPIGRRNLAVSYNLTEKDKKSDGVRCWSTVYLLFAGKGMRGLDAAS